MKEGMTEELPENVAFFLALKLRLKDCHDEQGYYHYQFDDNANSIARVDPLKPFTDSARENLNQQWHVLISKLAYLDVAHALSNEQHEYHCLYQHIKSWDMGNLGALHLQLLCSPNQPESKRIKLQLVKPETAPKPRTITYPSEAMNAWLKKSVAYISRQIIAHQPTPVLARCTSLSPSHSSVRRPRRTLSRCRR